MHPLFVVAKQEYRSNVRRRGFLATTLFWPGMGLLLLLFLYFQTGTMSEAIQGRLGARPVTELTLEQEEVGPSTQIGVVDEAALLTRPIPAALRR
nr:hypothetical protein [Ardenticatenales bacterium]